MQVVHLISCVTRFHIFIWQDGNDDSFLWLLSPKEAYGTQICKVAVVASGGITIPGFLGGEERVHILRDDESTDGKISILF